MSALLPGSKVSTRLKYTLGVSTRLFLLQAALLRDAVARINYEETGKKKALNFPDEEPPKEIMHRARVELDKARAKAAEVRTKPKAPSSVKTPAAMPFGPAHAAAALATLTQPPQEAHVRLIPAVDTKCCGMSVYLLQLGVR